MPDLAALALREATISVGIWLTWVVGGLGEVYVLATQSQPNRPALGVLFGMAIAAGFVVVFLPRERIVRSRYRELFFLSWSVLDLMLILLGALADGGTGSPLVLIFFVPVVFSAMSYPLGSVLAVGVMTLLSYLGLAATVGGSSTSYDAAFATALACTAMMSAAQARTHNRQHRALAEVSRADPLTGCLNRRGFEERAVAELGAMTRRARRGAVLVLDIDHFKPVNDRLGHAAGDELLCWVVRTLGAVVRPTDSVGRLGGDEFAILLPEIERGDAERLAERVRAALRERAPCSLGLAVFPDDGSDLEDLTRQADMRLYRSRDGRSGPETASVHRLVERLDLARGEGRDREVLQQALREQLDAAVVVTDLEGVVLDWNDGAEALYGWTSAEALGRGVVELVTVTAAEPAEQALEALRRDSRWGGEFVGRRKDGSTFAGYVRNRVVFDEQGEPAALVGVSVDISEAVAHESALLRSRHCAQAVAESIGEGLFVVDVDGRVTYMNAVAEALLGWPREELQGRVAHEVLHAHRQDGSQMPIEECPITRARRDGVGVSVEDDHFLCRSGRELAVAYSAAPFETDTGAKGCVVVFRDIAERKRAEAEHRHHDVTLAAIDRIQEAIAEDRFILHAQPIIDLRSGETVQHELLVRMRERDGEIVPPGAFLGVAEQYGLIGAVDRWVIKRATQIAAAGCSVELNISARSVGDVDVLEHIERCIDHGGADPARLVFELTETAIVEDQAAARRFAERLHVLGCKLALDDFGTGYGGFTYLKQIPVDYLKIDIEFVRDLASNRASHHVVQAMVALAHDFDLETVAEGVEDRATLGLLRELGVHYAQGFHIARPHPFTFTPDEDERSVGVQARAGAHALSAPAQGRMRTPVARRPELS